MRKFFLFLLSALIILNSMIIYANSSYNEFIDIVFERADIDASQIDTENVFVAEITNHLMMKAGKEPTMFYLMTPVKNTSDLYASYFERGNYVLTELNFSAVAPLKDFNIDDAVMISKNYKLAEPSEIKCLIIYERMHMFAYNILCDNETYIIPYYFTDESLFNVMNNEECKLEIGKPYTVSDFVNICEKEQVMYDEYRLKKHEFEKENTSYITVDKNGEDVEFINEHLDEQQSEEENGEFLESLENGLINDEEFIETDEFVNSIITNELPENLLPESTILSNSYDRVLEYGIMKGDKNGNLKLCDNVTRAEMAQLVVNALMLADFEVRVSPEDEFTDVLKEHWAYNAIMLARKFEIVNGHGDGTFRPDNFVTYDEAVKMVMEILGYKPEAEKRGGYPNGYREIAKLVGIIGDYTGDEYITRSEIAVMLEKALDVPMMVQVGYGSNPEYRIITGDVYGQKSKTLKDAFVQ